MTLAQLRYLLAIVDAGLNITVAAARINATQPGLSKQLKQLEEQLGLKVFVRHGRNLERLTEAGEEIVERARIIVAEADNIRALVANRRAGESGSLHVETTQIQAQFVLPEALMALKARFPQVDVSLGFSADGDDVWRRCPQSDFVMFSTDGRTPAGDVAIPLYSWDPVAAVPNGHPLASRTGPMTLAELARYPLITYDTSSNAPLSIARTFLEAGLGPRFAYTIRNAGVTKAAVRSGLGVGLLAEMAIDPGTDDDLQVIPLAGLFPRCIAWAVLRRDRVLRDYVAYLLAILSGLSARTIQRLAEGDIVEHGATPPLWSERVATLRAAATPRFAA
jgi:DNA-binding transcriptional LysR family regulator